MSGPDRMMSTVPRRRGPDQASHANLPSAVRDVVRSPGQPLDSRTATTLEDRLGHRFGNVRVHADSKADASARALNAVAYTTGDDIVFAAGKYAPHTAEGQRLLAHEAVHVLQQDRAGSLNVGVAPADSLAEKQAERLGESNLNPLFQSVSPTGPASNAPVWQVHRQAFTGTLVKSGTVQHTGDVGGPPPGQVGVPYGSVEVRTGDVVELKDKSRISNLISLQYSGALSGDAKWLQFVWFELTATTPAGTAHLTGNIPTSSGNKPFTTDPKAPNWSVDSASTADPFYEAGFLAIRSPTATTMFDAPGGASVSPLAQAVFGAGIGATSATFTAHFDTYLIVRNVAAYHVPWSASTVYTQGSGKVITSPTTYAVGGAGPATALPTNLATLLHSAFPKSAGVK
ncbi:MAG TPA: DUF4157 domain-containing protein [Chloroflexota bacterium]|nr:DUF4157 domain-containing protein [Chloroflexota bacterium]